MMTLMRSKFLRLTILLVLVVGCLVALHFLRWLNAPMQSLGSTPIVIELNAGDSLHRLARQYQKTLDLEYPRVWVAYAKATNLTRIKRGEYEVFESLSPVELLQLLNSGDVKQNHFTWVEGVTFKDALALLGELEEFESSGDFNTEQARVLLDIEQSNPEGWLFPDTYAYTKTTTVDELLVRSHEKMKSVLAEEWAGRAAGLPYESAYEALIMASIVEKETGVPYERAEIAGVFVRRLEKGMRLQTDPTVIYGLGDAYKGNLKRKHLRQKTPYNTYTKHGLPPTPIALPGRDAIHAALNPLDGESLYFVAKGDGSHQFSATLAEHVAAVKRFQLNRRADYRSSQ